MDRLESAMAKKNRQKLFEHLNVYLTAEKEDIPYQDMAAKLHRTEGSIRVAVHRLRRQYRKLLRDEIDQTVDGEDQIGEEMGSLFAALAY